MSKKGCKGCKGKSMTELPNVDKRENDISPLVKTLIVVYSLLSIYGLVSLVYDIINIF